MIRRFRLLKHNFILMDADSIHQWLNSLNYIQLHVEAQKLGIKYRGNREKVHQLVFEKLLNMNQYTTNVYSTTSLNDNILINQSGAETTNLTKSQHASAVQSYFFSKTHAYDTTRNLESNFSTSNNAPSTRDKEDKLMGFQEEATPSEVMETDYQYEMLNLLDYPLFEWVNVKEIAENIKNKQPAAFDKLSNDILCHYDQNIQDYETLTWKESIRLELLHASQRVFPSAKLFAVGSTMNGCGSYNSDMDLCILIHPNELAALSHDLHKQTIFALERLKIAFERSPVVKRVLRIYKTLVPILSITFNGSYSDLEVDVNINNTAGIYNTHLIHQYSRMDSRFPQICLLIKHWAIKHDISDARSRTFNSYSLICLVLHFMQCACKPPVLPNLQKLCPDAFDDDVPIENLRFFNDEVSFISENKDDLSTLLIGFFCYYCQFDFDKYAISVKNACVFLKKSLPEELFEKYSIFIEEPFDGFNTSRCVHGEGYERIKKAFNDMYLLICVDMNPSLKKMNIDGFE